MAGKKKHPGGRPTHYSDEIARQAREYLHTYKDIGHAIPSVAGLSMHIKRARSTIYQWAAHPDYIEFADILDEINACQEEVALTNGLKGEFNSQIVKLVLGKHGYSDKVETKSSVSFDDMPDDDIDARIRALEEQIGK